MINQTITPRQAVMWFCLYQTGSAMLILPSSLATIAKQDAWMCIPLAIVMFLGVSTFYLAIAKQMNGASFEDYFQRILGSLLGKIVLFLFVLLFPYLIFILVLRDLGDYLTTSVIPETPQAAIYALMLAAVYYVVRLGATVIGRIAEILFFVVMTLFLVGFLSLFVNADWRNLLPMLEDGPKPVFHASIHLLAFPYLESVLFLFFVNQFDHAKKWRRIIVRSAILSGFACFIVTMMSLLALSAGVISNLTYPSYFVVRTISIGDIFERFEVVISIIWYISIFFRLALLLYVSVQGFAGVFRLKYPRALLIPLSLIAIMMAKVVWPNMAFLITLLQVWPYYCIIFGLLFPIALWLVGKVRLSGSSDA
ncbi:GerAB/ArcD/ProY family transporter [Cohnella lupini]|uniref:Spore germination protein KB n=1 Tax=Cohnella lupini TaxID=1294267 RepID=A0A3D9IEM0_9BACL|nr:endospore germination permease [Cohnella lupini]RED60232.1 spore germination protein KB [Cohnella lupini]